MFQKPYLKALLSIFSVFPIFSYVRLNSNDIGQVIESYPVEPTRPKIHILFDAQSRRLSTKRIINLQKHPKSHIVDSVSEKELPGLSYGMSSN